MNNFFLILITIISLNSFSQDFSIYPRLPDDKVKLPYVHESMRLNEFQILSRTVRMMDMMYATIVPGYIHFKAKEMTTGYVLLGLRSASYISLSAVYLSSKSRGDKTIDIFNSNKPEQQIVINDNWSVETSDIIVGTAIAVIISTYLYDWIHGKYMLEKKQEMIRYKYSVKLKIEENKLSFNNTQPYSLGLALTLNF